MAIRAIVSNNKGAVSITAVIVMIVLGLLGGAYVSLTTTEMRISSNYRDGVAAQYLAEAGAMVARVKLKQDTSYRAQTGTLSGVTVNKNNNSITSGTYTVKVSLDPDEATNTDRRKIVATGTVNSARRQVVLLVNLGNGPGSGMLPEGTSELFKYGLFSGTNMVIENNAEVEGNVRSNASINVSNNSKVKGNVIAGISVNRGNNAKIYGTITQNANTLSVPALNSAPYKTGQNLSNLNINGSYTLNGGVYYINGDFILSNNSKLNGNGIIYVTGNVQIKNNVKIPGKVLIISEHDINIGNNASLSNALLYANQNITLSQNSSVTGAAVARGNINAQQNATLIYSKALVDEFSESGDDSDTVIDWSNK